MKTNFFVFLILSLSVTVVAQTPQSFNYQAVARDMSGAVMASANLGIRMSILDGSDNIMYSESHAKQTDLLGLFSLQVGTGTIITGQMSDIDWSAGPYFLKVDIDYNGGSDYMPVGSSQILAVPYALHAETVSQNDDADADPENEIQMLSIDGTELTISGGNSVNLPESGGTGDGDSDPNNEIQDLDAEKTNSEVMLSISKGGTGTSFTVDDADADATNELQSLSKSGNMITLTDGGSVEDAVDDADADATNELQSLSKSGNMITLSNGGSVEDAVDDADADATNELQSLSKSGNMITLSDGGSVEDAVDDADADATNELQNLSISGSTLSISNGNSVEIPTGGMDADADPTNELQQLSLLAVADAGIDGMTVYQLDLTDGGEPVTLPFSQWWNPTILLSDPPQVGNINTPYPVVVNNQINSNSLNSPVIESTDVTVGDNTVSATHIQSDNIHWDGGAVSDELGFFLEREEIRYGVTLPSSDFKAKLDKQSLRFVNGAGWTSTFLGGETTGRLDLYPGGGTPAYFSASLDAGPIVDVRDFSNLLSRTTVSSQGAGALSIYGPNGNLNIWNIHPDGLPNNGWLSVNDVNGTQQAGVYVNNAGQGIVWGDMKTFVMPHPTDNEKEIQYVSLEGPEAGAYERGTAQLVNGEASITFSDHFQHVIGDQNMTVMITPLSADSKGIAVIEKSGSGFKVKELLKGSGTYQFDWEVKAVRRGYEDFEVVRKKIELGTPKNKTTDASN